MNTFIKHYTYRLQGNMYQKIIDYILNAFTLIFTFRDLI